MKLWQQRLVTAGLSVVLFWTMILNVYHVGVLVPPAFEFSEGGSVAWLDKQGHGLHHLVLSGKSFERGKKAGEITRDLLRENETLMINRAEHWLPQPWMRQVAILGASIWYYGLDQFIDPEHLTEMYGISLSAPDVFNSLADRYTRQVGYHGWHDLGQKLVDQGFQDMGCTVIGVPSEKSWIVGRNFDFEPGYVFDRDKIIKWVFPEKKQAYVSIAWAGLVGAVTGVNEKGVYVSINAADSQDSARVGTPSTLVALKILEEAENARDALRILQDAKMFITAIFVVADGEGRFYRVEKSPEKMSTLEYKEPAAVTNHLITPEFEKDRINQNRKQELTTVAREARGKELARKAAELRTVDRILPEVLNILRDKGQTAEGRTLPLGNRLAIDALITTHSVIFDSSRQRLYIGLGPALIGEFQGYDLAASFKQRRPIAIDRLPADPAVKPQDYFDLHQGERDARMAQELVRQGRCEPAKNLLESVKPRFVNNDFYLHALGDIQLCYGQPEVAKGTWQQALQAIPAYLDTRRRLEWKIKR